MLLGPSLLVSAILFVIGVAGVLLRRNAIIVFMCVELMLNAVNLAFVALVQLDEGRTCLTFDEPESHLHPALLGRVLQLFERAVLRSSSPGRASA